MGLVEGEGQRKGGWSFWRGDSGTKEAKEKLEKKKEKEVLKGKQEENKERVDFRLRNP